MQTIPLRTSRVAPVCTTRRSTRRMVVRASIWDDFLKTFSPSKDNHPKTGVPGGFSGSPKHHGGREPGRAAASKPFADGYQKGGQVRLTKEEAEAMAQQEQLEAGENAVDYLGGAVQNLAGHNFTGDEETEPPTTTGAAGWKGDIHDRKRDGFHARKV